MFGEPESIDSRSDGLDRPDGGGARRRRFPRDDQPGLALEPARASSARVAARTSGRRSSRFCGRGLARTSSTKSCGPSPRRRRNLRPAARRAGVEASAAGSIPFHATRTGTGKPAAINSDSTARAHATSRAACPASRLARPSGQPGRWLWMVRTSGIPCAAISAAVSASRRCPWITSAAESPREPSHGLGAGDAIECERGRGRPPPLGMANACLVGRPRVTSWHDTPRRLSSVDRSSVSRSAPPRWRLVTTWTTRRPGSSRTSSGANRTTRQRSPASRSLAASSKSRRARQPPCQLAGRLDLQVQACRPLAGSTRRAAFTHPNATRGLPVALAGGLGIGPACAGQAPARTSQTGSSSRGNRLAEVSPGVFCGNARGSQGAERASDQVRLSRLPYDQRSKRHGSVGRGKVRRGRAAPANAPAEAGSRGDVFVPPQSSIGSSRPVAAAGRSRITMSLGVLPV